MTEESEFVTEALAAAKQVLQHPLSIERGKVLLYEETVDNNLSLTVDPKHPVRGDSAFQTDLCVFETKTVSSQTATGAKAEDFLIPRVVLEFKTGISNHDVLTYSAKARKHKQVYPYLRYGLVVSNEAVVPRRFFIHNDFLDFFAALKNTQSTELQGFFSRLFKAEVPTSRILEKIAFGNFRPHFFRMEVTVDAL